MQKFDDDGYTIIPPLTDFDKPKGIKCGECGAKFDHGKAYGFVCGNSRCPIQLKPSW